MPDFKTQSIFASIAGGTGSKTLVPGTDYVAPAAATKAMFWPSGYRQSGVTENPSAVNLGPNRTQAHLDAWGNVTSSGFSFNRQSSGTNALECRGRIIEYVGPAGGAHEFVVRDYGVVSGTNVDFLQGSVVNNGSPGGAVVDAAKVLVLITGVSSGRSNTTEHSDIQWTSGWNPTSQRPEFRRALAPSAGTTWISYQVVEFTGSAWSLERVSVAVTVAGSNQTIAIADVGATTRAFIYPQWRNNAGTLHQVFPEVWLSSTTQITYHVTTGATLSSAQLVVWILRNSETGAADRLNVQHTGPHTWTAVATPTVSVTAVRALDESMALVNGRHDSSGASHPRAFTATQMLNASTVQVYRGADGAGTLTGRVQVIEWPRTPSLTPVGRSASAAWDIRSAVGRAASAAWDIRSAVGRAASAAWDIRSAVGRASPVRWHIADDEVTPFLIASDPASGSPRSQVVVPDVTLLSGSGLQIHVHYNAAAGAPSTGHTWNSQPLTDEGSVSTGQSGMAVLTLPPGAGGTGSVVVNLSPATNVQVYVFEVRNTDGVDDRQSATGNATATAIPAVAGVTGGIVLGGANKTNTTPYTTPVEQTVLHEQNIGTGRVVGSWEPAGPATSHDYSFAALRDYAAWAVAWGPVGGLTPVGREAGVVWNVVAAAGRDAPSAWDVVALVGRDAGAAWSILETSSVAAACEWAILAAVGRDAGAAWDVRAAAGRDAATAWDIAGTVGREAGVVWNVVAAIGRDAASAWDVRVAAGREAATAWGILGAAGRDAPTAWNVVAAAGRDAVAEWDIEAAGTVGRSAALRWNIRTIAGRAAAAQWHIRAAAGRDAPTAWHIAGAVARDAASAWDVRVAAGRDAPSGWDVRAAAGRDAATAWDIRGLAGRAAGLAWDIGGSVGRAAPSAWNILQLAGRDAAAAWDVAAPGGLTSALAATIVVLPALTGTPETLTGESTP